MNLSIIDSKLIINQIKERVNIVDLISQATKLTKKGINYFGICPFHSEKTPSFSVNSVKQIFHCFGCGKTGDIFEFVMLHENISFKDALEKLALLANVDLPKNISSYDSKNQEEISLSKKIIAANELIKSFFHNALFKNEAQKAREYLKSRKISEDMWYKFEIGFAENNTKLHNFLVENKIDHETIENCFILNNSKHPKLYDRIIIPIISQKKSCVGFGGRLIINQESQPKYINSQESIVFKKREVLFGENFLNASSKNVIITEGYFDVISMTEAGFQNVVAPLGTALSELQMIKTWNYSQEPIIAFDGDSAGEKAMMRTVDRILPILDDSGKSFNFIKLPETEDLDSIVHNDKEKLTEILKKPILLKDMLKQKLFSDDFDQISPERILKLENKLNEIIEQIKSKKLKKIYYTILHNEILKQYSKENTKNNFLFTNKTYNRSSNKQQKTLNDTVIASNEKLLIQKKELLLAIVILNPYILETVYEQFMNLEYQQNLINDVMKLYMENNSITAENMLEKLKILSYNSIISDIFEKNIHVKLFLRKSFNCDSIINYWMNLYNEVINSSTRDHSDVNLLKKWKDLKILNKKFENL